MLQQSTYAEVVAFYGDPLPCERAGRAYGETIIRAKIAALQSLLGESEAIRWAGPRVAPAKRATAGKAKRVQSAAPTAEGFWTLHKAAVRACSGEYGRRWKIKAPFGDTVLVSVPAGWRSFKGPKGTTIRYRRDHRMPAARFWPGGVLPDKLEVTADVPRETADRAWGDNRRVDNHGYAEWQAAWAKRNGLIAVKGVWLTPAQYEAIPIAD